MAAPRPSRYPTTPEGYQAMVGSLDTKQRQVFAVLVRRAEQHRAKAEDQLQAHVRPHRVIPLAQQAALDAAIGLRRSLIGLCLLVGPASGVVLVSFGHALAGLLVGGVSVGLAWGLRLFNQHRMRQGELEPGEVKAMAQAAQADPVGRKVWARWRQDGHPFSQRDYAVMGHYLGSQDQLRRWQEVDRRVRGVEPQLRKRMRG